MGLTIQTLISFKTFFQIDNSLQNAKIKPSTSVFIHGVQQYAIILSFSSLTYTSMETNDTSFTIKYAYEVATAQSCSDTRITSKITPGLYDCGSQPKTAYSSILVNE